MKYIVKKAEDKRKKIPHTIGKNVSINEIQNNSPTNITNSITTNTKTNYTQNTKKPNTNTNINKTNTKPNNPKFYNKDPSLQYIKHPTATPIIKQAKKFFSSQSIPFNVTIGPIHQWRTLSKLACRGCKKDGLIKKHISIGLFKPGSHDIVSCNDSVVHHRSINDMAKLIESICVRLKVTGYREDTDIGLLRYLILCIETTTNKVQVTLVVNSHPTESTTSNDQLVLNNIINDLISHNNNNNELIHSIWVHYNPTSRHNNSITGRLENSWQHRYGEEYLRELLITGMEEVSNIRPYLCFPPNVFRQANLVGFSKIIRTIRSYIPPNSRVIELYGGVGTIGLNCLDLVDEIQCSDENPYNKICFEKTLSELHKKKYKKRAKYISAAAAYRANDLQNFDLCIVDPPRKGLDDEVKQALNNLNRNSTLKRLIYISCGFKGFSNDADTLLKKWKIIHAEGHILFPGSDHIETCAIFDRIQ
jgi:23S rRNA (uracil1939-C5)-methyltransferase